MRAGIARQRVGRFTIGATMAALAATGLYASGCGGTPSDPTPQLQVSCPAATTVESLSGNPMGVDYGAATATGGSPPVSTSCIPSSGSVFSVGSTPVTCTARDAKQHVATCSLNVTVTRPGTLSATRFMAFGDSITFGTPASFCPGSSGLTTREMFRRDLNLLFQRTSVRAAPPTSYPSVLQGLLSNRYVTQSPIVVNEGVGGETITDDTGGTRDETLARLAARLLADAPQVVLLQEGINDLNGNPLHPEVSIPQVVKALRDMIRAAQSRGARVFLGTLLPENPDGCRGRVAGSIAGANAQIKAMAAAEGVVAVDLFEAFGGVPGPYIGFEDGLHPTPLGYEKMAQTFLDSIRKTLEVPR